MTLTYNTLIRTAKGLRSESFNSRESAIASAEKSWDAGATEVRVYHHIGQNCHDDFWLDREEGMA